MVLVLVLGGAKGVVCLRCLPYFVTLQTLERYGEEYQLLYTNIPYFS